ncbi:hypothetical protein EJ04DRAFT_590684 [Polyplosphaeria fusca]|uniref:Uncharacterized protein n=1 Tax=Polyplosphaeria fusca TaxID=682080 RepID=A0A9P4QPZ8_9PLEO|nr:hypothetical protein EJ04DRAFT_590684 [Polyplosphaeria fusca]
MSSQKPTRSAKRKKGSQNPSVTTSGPSGSQDTPSSGWLLTLPDIPDDLSIPTELYSNNLPISTDHQSSHPGSRQAQPNTSQSSYESRFDYTWVDWTSLPYYTVDLLTILELATVDRPPPCFSTTRGRDDLILVVNTSLRYVQ